MTAMIIRILVGAVVIGIIWFGLRRIWSDWTKQFRAEDAAIRERDLEERKRPDVITLERAKDGTFRPPGSEDR